MEDEPELFQVKLLITYPCPHDQDRTETTWVHMFDLAPEFEATQAAVELYQEVPGVEIQIWYTEPPEKEVLPEPTHSVSMGLQ